MPADMTANSNALSGAQRSNRIASGSHFQRASRVAAGVAIAVGAAAIVGWLFDVSLLKSGLPGLATMKLNTAISFVLAGLALLARVRISPARAWAWSSRLGAALVAAVGALTLLEYITNVSIGLDELLLDPGQATSAAAHPGRMAPNTAVGFVLIGLALLAVEATNQKLLSLTQALSIGALLIGFVALTGYALSASALFGLGYTSMALHTAILFVVLGLGVLAVRPEHGVVAILLQDNSAGAAVRRLVPFIVIVPFAVAWLLLHGALAGLYGTALGLALMSTINTIVIASLAIWNAQLLGASDARLKRAAEQFRLAIEAAPTGMLVVERSGKFVLVNAQVERVFGYRRSELLGQPIELLLPERLRARHPGHRSQFIDAPEARPMGSGRELYDFTGGNAGSGESRR